MENVILIRPKKQANVCNDDVLIPGNHAKFLSKDVNTWENLRRTLICNTDIIGRIHGKKN
uniref:Uncharacterized protein n=1 Tax=Romanomermis culicivorax TaxID=13658 RepID=A0A915JD84_ROMCU